MKKLFRLIREMFHRDLLKKMSELQNEFYAIKGKMDDSSNPPQYEAAEIEPLLHQGYAAFGEDLIMASVLKKIFLINSLENVKYLEIGTCSPNWYNNTYYFYRKGARGVLVEPNPILHQLIREIRPGDVLIEKGISCNGEKSMTYYEFDGAENLGWNTFVKEHADIAINQANLKLLKKNELPMISISEILERYFNDNISFDILQIDAEGMDFDIIKSMDFSRFRPKIICMEMAAKVHNHTIIWGEKQKLDYMKKINYECIASTAQDMIFVDTGQI
jgi:hypothetical protein